MIDSDNFADRGTIDERDPMTSNVYLQRQPVVGQTALGRLNEELEIIPIVTFCQAIDEMLGGGIAPGKQR